MDTMINTISNKSNRDFSKYKFNGNNNEPIITFLAKDFETFILGLKNREEFEI